MSPGVWNFRLSGWEGGSPLLSVLFELQLVHRAMAGYNRGIMPRVGEFCPSNIARLLLGVVIVVTLVAAIGVWLFHSPGRGTPIEQPSTTAQPVK
jgi:hypothetical protein